MAKKDYPRNKTSVRYSNQCNTCVSKIMDKITQLFQ